MFRNPAGLLNVGNIERASCIWLTELLCEAQLKSVWMCARASVSFFLPVKNINNKQYKMYKTVKLAGFENSLPQSAAFIVVVPPAVAHIRISAARQQEVWNTSSRSQRFSALLWLFFFLFWISVRSHDARCLCCLWIWSLFTFCIYWTVWKKIKKDVCW